MKKRLILLAVVSVVVAATFWPQGQATAATPPPLEGNAVATFAGGCFWCMEPPFDKLDGVRSTTSGYTGGHLDSPSYEQVSRGGTGHAEAVRIIYDPTKISYRQLLDVFWKNIDPTVRNRQFCDVGDQYRSAIFYHDDDQKRLALETKAEIESKKGFNVLTEVVAAPSFYAAEEYHQDYYLKNPVRYKYYRNGCGRDKRLEQTWGK